MPAKTQVDIGFRRGRLEVIGPANRPRYWKVRCDCGTIKEVGHCNIISKNGTRSCGCLAKEHLKHLGRVCVGEKHHSWRGGRRRSGDGYVQLLVGRRTYVFEHRQVMEKHIGRALLPDETVHHKNGIRDDNRIENLELWSSRHTPGQRVEDIVSDYEQREGVRLARLASKFL